MSNLFGGNGSTPPTSGPGIFGGRASTAGGNLFGGAAATSTTGGGGSLFASSTGNGPQLFSDTKPATSGPSPLIFGSQTTNDPSGGLVSGGAAATSGSGFRNLNNASTSTPAGSMTPATTRTAAFSFGTSTTPAGPPPTSNGQSLAGTGGLGRGGGGLFANLAGSNTPASRPGDVFGAGSPTTTTASSTSATPSFGFGALAQPSSTSTTQASTTPAPGPSAGPSLFSGLAGAPKPPTSSAPPNLFAGLGGAATSTPATSTPNTGLFGAASSTAPSSSTPTPAPAATSSLFSGLGNSSAAPTTSTPATSTPPAARLSLFGGTPASSQAPAATSSSTTDAAAAAPTGTATSGATGLAAATSTLGQSTSGPAPQLSRLKNKTMDEIITRWAGDLSKYQKEFQEQAAKVSEWDRLLVNNGEKIQKLYQSTYEAERETSEVERQLSNVENQQDELAGWLDKYEAEVDELFNGQMGLGNQLQGPDQERERTYKLAEKLSDRLDDMGNNLKSMIGAINSASSSLSKSSQVDDPLSSIVRVLNDHLSQLQWIDQNATLLQAKIAEAQKLGQSIGSNGYGGLENDAAESFYRSIAGRR
ncbi:nuclear pore complex protein An-Nsp1 [Amylocarpus encephaloides]|uniref:Nucleoporin NSP1 n=1 Tax=Amylocarpus encephaloides TaxID=45428 RepID=A0A9P7YPM5_9HELO|nr:nuclear pore complex protein An-Nsp1 [Amylocarpus encephaloides]